MKKVWRLGLLRNVHVKLKHILLAAAFVLPLSEGQDWKVLSFRKIEANQVQFKTDGLQITINNSAGPLIYKFQDVNKVKKVKVTGRWQGEMKLGGPQGSKKNDDFILRVGFVRPGDKTLNFIQKKIAPEWILEMHKLAPAGVGVSHIDFLCAYQDKKLQNTKRQHPLSELLIEHFVWLADKPGEFTFEYEFPKAEAALGLWLSSDGDDTGSKYQVSLHRIELEFEAGNN